MTEIAVALITLAGVILTVFVGNKQTAKTVKAQTDLTIYRIEQLEKKQDVHNGLIKRMFKAEEEVAILKEKVKVENHRIDDLEAFHKPQQQKQ